MRRNSATKIVNTRLGTLLDRVAEHVKLPLGTRLGVKVGHRQLRSDFRFSRPALSKTQAVKGRPNTITVQDAVEQFVIPRLPPAIRKKKARVLVFRPGERKPAGAVQLSTARAWGDGRTVNQGEEFDEAVQEVFEKLEPIFYEAAEDINSEEICLRAVCKFFVNQKQMLDIIKKHDFKS